MLIVSRLTSSRAVATAAANDFDIELGNASGRGPRFLECVVLPLIALKGTTGVERDHLRWVPPAPVPALKRQVGRCFVIPRRDAASSITCVFVVLPPVAVLIFIVAVSAHIDASDAGADLS